MIKVNKLLWLTNIVKRIALIKSVNRFELNAKFWFTKSEISQPFRSRLKTWREIQYLQRNQTVHKNLTIACCRLSNTTFHEMFQLVSKRMKNY